MFFAEVKGVKRRAYELWLTKEAERVEEARGSMLVEDVIGSRMRTYWDARERALRVFEPAVATKEDFALATEVPLPGSYDYLTEDVPCYEYGTGLDNEDEIEEYLEEQRREAELARKRDELEAKAAAEVRKQQACMHD